MCAVFELSTRDYDNSSFQIKKALSHLETICEAWSGYRLGPPKSKFGWTFFAMIIQPQLQSGIESKFADMISRYRFSKQPEKFTKFFGDYLDAKKCNVRVRLIDF